MSSRAVLCAWFAALQALDGVLTLAALSSGYAVEVNFVVVAAMDAWGVWGLYLAKVVAASTVVALAYGVPRIVAEVTLLVLGVFAAFVASWNAAALVFIMGGRQWHPDAFGLLVTLFAVAIVSAIGWSVIATEAKGFRKEIARHVRGLPRRL